jgi:hypothetical protein
MRPVLLKRRTGLSRARVNDRRMAIMRYFEVRTGAFA